MREGLVVGCLLVPALIHLLPVIGVLSARRVADLYDVPVEGPDLAVLLRHRALLFGVLVALLVWAVVDDELRAAAVVLTLVADLGYVVVCALHRDHNPALRRVLHADLVSIAALVVAGALLLD